MGAVDSATGTIKLRGEFANKEDLLWPGRGQGGVVVQQAEQDLAFVGFGAGARVPNGPVICGQLTARPLSAFAQR